MTGKMQAKKSWQLAEQHGLWWAYEGDLPPPEAFQTHGRPRHVPILGPYPSRKIAEALLRRHLERRRAIQASHYLSCRRLCRTIIATADTSHIPPSAPVDIQSSRTC